MTFYDQALAKVAEFERAAELLKRAANTIQELSNTTRDLSETTDGPVWEKAEQLLRAAGVTGLPDSSHKTWTK